MLWFIMAVVTIGLLMLKEQGHFTLQKKRWAAASFTLLLALGACVVEYGGLRGSILWLAVLSVMGTLIPLFMPTKRTS